MAAEPWFRSALELHHEVGDRTMETWSRHMLALALAGQKRWADARDVGRRALRDFFEAGDVAGVTLVLDDLAIVAVGEGERERAGRLWGAARHLQRTTGTGLADYVEQTDNLFGIGTPRDLLAPDELTRLSAEGEAMTLDEVVAYALEGVPGDTVANRRT